MDSGKINTETTQSTPPDEPLDAVMEPGSVLDRVMRRAAGWIVFLSALALYLRTMCPTIYYGDGAELTAAAYSLGVPHPTGYPLFMVLGFLFLRLGLGSPAFGMNALVAIFGALAAAGACWMLHELFALLVGEKRARQASFVAAAAAFGLSMAAGSTWWDQSTHAEVYTLLLVFVTSAWAMAIRLIRGRWGGRGLAALAAWSGIAFLHHMLFLITIPMTLCAMMAWWRRGGQTRPIASRAKVLALAALLFAVPLTGYLYLPLRAAARPAINWGNPQGLSGILWHLRGAQYTGNRILADPMGRPLPAEAIPRFVAGRLGEIGRWMGRQVNPDDPRRPTRGPVLALVALLLAGLGLICLGRQSPWAAAGLFGGLALNLVLVILYTIADIQAYQIPLWLGVVALAVLGGIGVAGFFPQRHPTAEAREAHWRLRAWIAAGVLLAMAIWGAVQWYPPEQGLNKAEERRAYEYAVALMDQLPEGAVVFTFGDYDIFPLWYLQVCERRRPDVAVVGANFALNGWYGAMLERALPEGLEMWLGDEPPSSKQRWLAILLGGMMAPALEAGHPVFLTQAEADIARFFSLQPRFLVPSPYPLAFTATADRPADSGEQSRMMTVFQMTDPRGFSTEARIRFRAQFPPDQARSFTGTGGQ